MKLSIVIPALNEEDAIGSTIERCLAARDAIIAESPVRDVEVIVVSDGSTDRTPEIAAGYDDVHLIVFERNRGYGAAIKEGFAQSSGELVAFLDADGTCDPRFFGLLCQTLARDRADVALGARLGPQSRMPGIRRLGNRIYALILSALSNQVITDTASGMRVIRRDALSQLYPLPDGLHFTPAMSARVLMDDELRLVEVPMTYEERVGESKLHVLRDGVRFLRTIMEMTLMWRPARLFAATSALLLTVMVLLAAHPIEMWLTQGRLEEDMIYRLLFCSFVGTLTTSLVAASVVAALVHQLTTGRSRPRSFVSAVLDRVHTLAGVGVATVVALPMLGWLVGPGLWTRLTAGYVDLHWSRVVLGGLIAFGLVQLTVTTLLAHLLRFHLARTLNTASPAPAEPPTSTTRQASARRARGVPTASRPTPIAG